MSDYKHNLKKLKPEFQELYKEVKHSFLPEEVLDKAYEYWLELSEEELQPEINER